MVRERVADLEELVLRCRDQRARSFIAEAVACYYAGAYRSCIVSTWIAIVWDFLHKLRLLEMMGDGNAARTVQQFEQYRDGNNLDKLLEFERSVIDVALKDFEFISPIEAIDLKRVFEDRNRCAHPSMTSREDEYQPSAELARSHIRNAVDHLLQHEPAQGKAALTFLFADVESVSFPPTAAAAVQYFRNGSLLRGRESLVRNFTTATVKALLLQESDEARTLRLASALAAVREIRREIAEPCLRDTIEKIMRGGQIDDPKYYKVLFLLAQMPDVWDLMDDDIKSRIRRHVREMPDDCLLVGISHALDFSPLSSEARARLAGISVALTGELLGQDPRTEYVDHAISLVGMSEDYDSARRRIRRLVNPYLLAYTAKHLDKLLDAIAQNNQLSDNTAIEPLLSRLREQMIVSRESFGELMRSHGLDRKFQSIVTDYDDTEDEE